MPLKSYNRPLEQADLVQCLTNIGSPLFKLQHSCNMRYSKGYEKFWVFRRGCKGALQGQQSVQGCVPGDQWFGFSLISVLCTLI